MASRTRTMGLAIACLGGITLTVVGMAGAQPKTKVEEQHKSVHGTARPTQQGFTDKEGGMGSMDVRKAVHGKSGRDKY